MNYTQEEKEYFMREALQEAQIALGNDEIPIGCVLGAVYNSLIAAARP